MACIVHCTLQIVHSQWIINDSWSFNIPNTKLHNCMCIGWCYHTRIVCLPCSSISIGRCWVLSINGLYFFYRCQWVRRFCSIAVWIVMFELCFFYAKVFRSNQMFSSLRWSTRSRIGPFSGNSPNVKIWKHKFVNLCIMHIILLNY